MKRILKGHVEQGRSWTGAEPPIVLPWHNFVQACGVNRRSFYYNIRDGIVNYNHKTPNMIKYRLNVQHDKATSNMIKYRLNVILHQIPAPLCSQRSRLHAMRSKYDSRSMFSQRSNCTLRRPGRKDVIIMCGTFRISAQKHFYDREIWTHMMISYINEIGGFHWGLHHGAMLWSRCAAPRWPSREYSTFWLFLPSLIWQQWVAAAGGRRDGWGPLQHRYKTRCVIIGWRKWSFCEKKFSWWTCFLCEKKSLSFPCIGVFSPLLPPPPPSVTSDESSPRDPILERALSTIRPLDEGFLTLPVPCRRTLTLEDGLQEYGLRKPYDV